MLTILGNARRLCDGISRRVFLRAGGLGALSLAAGLTESAAGERPRPRLNLTDDPYFTDGLRLVVQLGTELRPPSSVEFLPWERPSLLTGTDLGGAVH